MLSPKKRPHPQRQIFFLTLTIAWITVIFSFSAKPAEESKDLSLTVGYTIGQMFVADFEEWAIEKQGAFAERINYPVRKFAHATEYAILGFLLAGTIVKRKNSRVEQKDSWQQKRCLFGNERRKLFQFLLCFIIGAVYAATDEFHQLFVPGRAGKITDVLIDSGGILFGLLIAYVFWQLFVYFSCYFK